MSRAKAKFSLYFLCLMFSSLLQSSENCQVQVSHVDSGEVFFEQSFHLSSGDPVADLKLPLDPLLSLYPDRVHKLKVSLKNVSDSEKLLLVELKKKDFWRIWANRFESQKIPVSSSVNVAFSGINGDVENREYRLKCSAES